MRATLLLIVAGTVALGLVPVLAPPFYASLLVPFFGYAIVSWPALRRVGGLFIPATIFIALIPSLGMYVAAGGYMLLTVGAQRRVSLAKTVMLAVATPLFLYLVFEKLFVVSLPHGALLETMGF